MTTNFSVSDAAVQSYVTNGGIEVTRYRQDGAAVLQAVARSGGQVYNNLPPVPTTIPVFHGQTAVGGTAESTRASNSSLPNSARDVEGRNLLIAAHGEVEKTTDQSLRASLLGVGSADAYLPRLVATKSPAIYGGFDGEQLASVLTGATDIEWTGNGIAALDAAMAIYDETAYNGDAMIVTRRGARQMGLAQNADNMLQFPGGVQGIPFDGPILRTDATAADIGVPNLLAVIGPFASCAVGMANATEVKVFDQLEPTNGGSQENIISFKVQRYLGFISPSTSVIPATGWVTIIDQQP